MFLRRALVIVVALLALASLAQTLYWAPQLPERVASHFDASDRADGWTGRTGFVILATGLHLLMALLFLGLPLLIERLPDGLINLPHKEYWLAPERRQASQAALATALLLMGVATQLLLLVVFQAVFRLNAGLASGAEPAQAAPVLAMPVPTFALLAAYMAVVVAITAWVLLHFRRPAGLSRVDRRDTRGAQA